MKQGWIDISVPIRPGLVRWPGDPPVRVERVYSMERGSECNVSSFSMSVHAGTHIDAPLHYHRTGQPVHTMPFSATIGAARVLEVRDRVSIKPEELRWHRIRCGERILFKTTDSSRYWESETFDESFVYLTVEAAGYLAARQVRAVGIDSLSVGGFRKDLAETHRILLGAGVWIIEGLDLSRVGPGRYELICLPLKIIDADGAPARAILRPRG